MKELKRGDMMEMFGKVDHFIVCVGSTLRKDHSLVMVNGLAGALGTLYPTLPVAMGKWIKETCGDCGLFYLRASGKVGIMQNMITTKCGPSLGIIGEGVKLLSAQALANPEKTFALEWPGYNEPEWLLGNMLDSLPANVEVWKP